MAAMDLSDMNKMSPLDLRKIIMSRVTSMLELVAKIPDADRPRNATPRARFDVNKSVIKVEGEFICFPHAVTFTSSYQPTSLRVAGDNTEFERALVNIIANGCAAVALSDDPQIRLTATAGKDFIEVTIADNGHGMDAATLAQIFQAGFTTKKQRPNHGQGLWITANIVADLGGSIKCESEPGKGALFRIWMPAA